MIYELIKAHLSRWKQIPLEMIIYQCTKDVKIYDLWIDQHPFQSQEVSSFGNGCLQIYKWSQNTWSMHLKAPITVAGSKFLWKWYNFSEMVIHEYTQKIKEHDLSIYQDPSQSQEVNSFTNGSLQKYKWYQTMRFFKAFDIPRK